MIQHGAHIALHDSAREKINLLLLLLSAVKFIEKILLVHSVFKNSFRKRFRSCLTIIRKILNRELSNEFD